MSNLQETVNNKDVEKYLGLFPECSHTNADGKNENKGKTHITKEQTRTKKRNERRKKVFNTNLFFKRER